MSGSTWEWQGSAGRGMIQGQSFAELWEASTLLVSAETRDEVQAGLLGEMDIRCGERMHHVLCSSAVQYLYLPERAGRMSVRQVAGQCGLCPNLLRGIISSQALKLFTKACMLVRVLGLAEHAPALASGLYAREAVAGKVRTTPGEFSASAVQQVQDRLEAWQGVLAEDLGQALVHPAAVSLSARWGGHNPIPVPEGLGRNGVHTGIIPTWRACWWVGEGDMVDELLVQKEFSRAEREHALEVCEGLANSYAEQVALHEEHLVVIPSTVRKQRFEKGQLLHSMLQELGEREFLAVPEVVARWWERALQGLDFGPIQTGDTPQMLQAAQTLVAESSGELAHPAKALEAARLLVGE